MVLVTGCWFWSARGGQWDARASVGRLEGGTGRVGKGAWALLSSKLYAGAEQPSSVAAGGGSGASFSEEEWRNKYESMKSKLPM